MDEPQDYLGLEEYLAGDQSNDLVWNHGSLHKHFFEEVAELEKAIGCKDNREESFDDGVESFRLCSPGLQLTHLKDVGSVKTNTTSTETVSKKEGYHDKIETDLDSEAISDDIKGGQMQSPNSTITSESAKTENVLLLPVQNKILSLSNESSEASSCTSSSASVESIEDEMKQVMKRQRNNKASKKFRRAKKTKLRALFEKEQKLQAENQDLRLQLSQLQNEVMSLKKQLPSNWKFQMILFKV